MKFTKNQVELCGEMRKYRRFTNKQLKQHQKEIESIFDNVQPIIDEIGDLQDELLELNDELKDIDDTIFIISNKEEPTDKERDTVIKLIKDKKGIRANMRKLKKQIHKIDKDHDKETKALEESVPKSLAKLASIMVEITEEDYLELSTDIDDAIIKKLSFVKKMADADMSSKDIEKFIRGEIDKEYKPQKQSFQRREY